MSTVIIGVLWKVRENLWNCQSQWKVWENCVFRFVVYKFSSRFRNAFSSGKDEKYAAKQAKRSIWHSTFDTCSSCSQWFSLWMLSFLFPRKEGRGWKWRENYRWPAEKAKVKVNMDCFSLIKGQWKLSVKSQGIFIFLMSGNPFVR